MIGKIKGYIHKYDKYISPIALIGGFILDAVTLRGVDFVAENVLLIIYLTIVFSGIAFMRYADMNGVVKLRRAVFILTQFAIGGLFSACTIFYSRSGSWVASWPFLLVLLGFMVSSEFMKKYYSKLLLQIIVAYLALFSYLIFSIPLITKTIGSMVFLLSGGLSLFIMFLYTKYIGEKLIKDNILHSRESWLAIIATYAMVTFFYFVHIIPPIPLSLTEGGAFTYISREGGEYVFSEKPKSWYSFLPFAEDITIAKGAPLYFYSSVFSPTDLNTNIVHDWQYYSDSEARWESISRIRFPIQGGRAKGYRGYSVKSNLTEGTWRVDVETDSGQLIGRRRFEVMYK
jgi:hypothetical protein